MFDMTFFCQKIAIVNISILRVPPLWSLHLNLFLHALNFGFLKKYNTKR